jgi:hypothetical protein
LVPGKRSWRGDRPRLCDYGCQLEFAGSCGRIERVRGVIIMRRVYEWSDLLPFTGLFCRSGCGIYKYSGQQRRMPQVLIDLCGSNSIAQLITLVLQYHL